MRESNIRNKTFMYAVRVVRVYQHLVADKKEFILSKQLLRSATGVGAMVREAEHSESKADFIHKLAIAQKEVNESIYWLELLKATDLLDHELVENINKDAIEILKILTTIIKNTKAKLKTKN